jgi:hypothetical protein
MTRLVIDGETGKEVEREWTREDIMLCLARGVARSLAENLDGEQGEVSLEGLFQLAAATEYPDDFHRQSKRGF